MLQPRFMALGALLLGTLRCSAAPAPSAAGDDPTAPDDPELNPGAGGSAAIDPDPQDPSQDPQSPLENGLVAAPRVVRLTHAQWENSVAALLGLPAPTGLSASFAADPRTAGFVFDNHAASLQVDQILWQSYQSAAAELASTVVQDTVLIEALLPVDTGDMLARASAFIRSFGERAFRRPLTTAEADRYLELYDEGTTLYQDTTGFLGGIRLVIEAFLQSPPFLYRVESSIEAVGAGIGLGAWEIAQRLSYFLTNSTPDDALLQAAREGTLLDPETIRAEAERLVALTANAEVMRRYHAQLFDVADYVNASPSDTAFNVPAGFGALLTQEAELFTRDVVVTQGLGLQALLTSPQTYVNAATATIYGLEGSFDDSFVKVTLSGAERRGILTQLGFLATNATSLDPDPIHRGVFVSKRLLCQNIAAPPDGVPPVPPVDQGTNRQAVEAHTEAGPPCVTCHALLINPYGFPFENYDAVGGYRTTDNDFAVDPATTPVIDGVGVAVANALEFADALAGSAQAHRCYSAHLLEFALGRESVAADSAVVEALARLSREDGIGTVALAVELSSAEVFRMRSQEELP